MSLKAKSGHYSKIAYHYYLRLYVMILLEDDELHFDLLSFVVILLLFSFSSAVIKIEEAISFTTCSQKTAAAIRRISSLAAWS